MLAIAEQGERVGERAAPTLSRLDVAYAAIGLASVTFFVWGHHMFVNGQSDLASLALSALSFAVAVPSAVKVYNWTATIHKGSLCLDTPMLYAMGISACSCSAG